MITPFPLLPTFERARDAIFAIEKALPLQSPERVAFYHARLHLGTAWDMLKERGLFKPDRRLDRDGLRVWLDNAGLSDIDVDAYRVTVGDTRIRELGFLT